MRWRDWKNSSWGHRGLLLLTTILVLCIASNPELAPFVPILDALGLDVLFYLLTAQLSGTIADQLLPIARYLYEQWVRKIVRCASHATGFAMGGYLRQLVQHMKHAGMVATFFGTGALGRRSARALAA